MPAEPANPLLAPWDTPFGLPPFGRIRAEHFEPAFAETMRAHRAQIDAIASSAEPPTFENTIVALDGCGRAFRRVEQVFSNLTASETSQELQEIERLMAPKLAAHHSAILLDERLFARVDAVHAHAGALHGEDRALLERIHLDFVLAGARLDAAAKARLAAIAERFADVSTRFAQNVLADEASFEMVLRDEADLAGLPESVRAAARQAAEERRHAGAWVITLSRSLVVPFLTFSERRDLRRRAHEAWTTRGEHEGPHDNRPLIREIMGLRQEAARLLGHPSYAHAALVDRMARTPDAARALLLQAWAPARERAIAERAALSRLARERGEDPDVQPWDWRFLAEKLRARLHDVDEAAVKPYFSIDAVTSAAFDCARRLFGITFTPRPDLETYHPDVRAYEVRRSDGSEVGVFLHDNFARPTKRSGAWMSSFRLQSRAGGESRPIVVNNNNVAKGAGGRPTLLSADDSRTLFHELGHGLHGLLSDVTYERLSGTRVLQDYVELPSQLYEHWLLLPEVLARHARHVETGEPIPEALVEKLRRARRFNQGFETVEYLASALVDLALHERPDAGTLDLEAFEAAELERLGMPEGILMRHRLPHFLHLFSSDDYAAGYYSYMWAEVLEADAFDAFVEAGDPFDADVASRLLACVYGTGGTRDPGEAFRAFRGRDPDVRPMLVQRGLVDDGASAAAP